MGQKKQESYKQLGETLSRTGELIADVAHTPKATKVLALFTAASRMVIAMIRSLRVRLARGLMPASAPFRDDPEGYLKAAEPFKSFNACRMFKAAVESTKRHQRDEARRRSLRAKRKPLGKSP